MKYIIEGKVEGRIEVTERRFRRRRKLLENLKDATGYRKLKEEALGLTNGQVALEGLWTCHRTHYGRINELMNERINE